MNRAGLACVLGLALVGGACAADRVAAPAPVAAGIRGGDGEDGMAAPPLFVVDGRIVVEGDGTRIDPDHILDAKVLGSEPAVRTYGARGAHGAVLIATRPAPAGAGGPFAGCWLANGCNDVALPPPPPPTAARPVGIIRIFSTISIRPGQGPLFVIDGQGCWRAEDCDVVSPGDITGVTAAAGGPEATALYGSAAATGIVFITTRHARK